MQFNLVLFYIIEVFSYADFKGDFYSAVNRNNDHTFQILFDEYSIYTRNDMVLTSALLYLCVFSTSFQNKKSFVFSII